MVSFVKTARLHLLGEKWIPPSHNAKPNHLPNDLNVLDQKCFLLNLVLSNELINQIRYDFVLAFFLEKQASTPPSSIRANTSTSMQSKA